MQERAEWLTLRELALRCGVSEATAGNWRRRYGDLIPSVLGRDGIVRYAPRPFEVIAAMRRRNLPAEEIRRVLAEDGPEPPDIQDSGARIAVALEKIAADLKRIADKMDPPERG